MSLSVHFVFALIVLTQLTVFSYVYNMLHKALMATVIEKLVIFHANQTLHLHLPSDPV